MSHDNSVDLEQVLPELDLLHSTSPDPIFPDSAQFINFSINASALTTSTTTSSEDIQDSNDDIMEDGANSVSRGSRRVNSQSSGSSSSRQRMKWKLKKKKKRRKRERKTEEEDKREKLKKVVWNKTGVSNDPLGQTHSLVSSNHYFNLKIVLKSIDGFYGGGDLWK